MVSAISIGLVVAGAVILFAGAALSIYGVALLGMILGGGAGYLVAPEVGLDGTTAIAGAVLVGALVGIIITYLLLSMAIGTLAFVVGTYMGMVAIDGLLDPGTAFVAVGGLVVGLVAAFLGTIFKRTMMILITAVVGAALASRSLTASAFEEAQSAFTIDPLLFELDAPLFIGLFVLGVLVQFGLFKLGWVTKLVTKLPGASVLRDRSGGESS